jgi:hypothetical protein
MQFNKALNGRSNLYGLEASMVFENHWCSGFLLLRLKIVEVWMEVATGTRLEVVFVFLRAAMSGKCRF